jgi:hypothetical protein
MEKLQLCALMPFMLCMSYFTLLVQENTSKEQELPKIHRKSLLAHISLIAKFILKGTPSANLGAKSEARFEESRH